MDKPVIIFLIIISFILGSVIALSFNQQTDFNEDKAIQDIYYYAYNIQNMPGYSSSYHALFNDGNMTINDARDVYFRYKDHGGEYLLRKLVTDVCN